MIRDNEVKLMIPCESELNKKGFDLMYCSTTEEIVFILGCFIYCRAQIYKIKHFVTNITFKNDEKRFRYVPNQNVKPLYEWQLCQIERQLVALSDGHIR